MNAKLLALALGWKEEQIKPCTTESSVLIKCEDRVTRDLSVRQKSHFWRIAERYNCFPTNVNGKWICRAVTGDVVGFNTPEEAVYDYVVNLG